MDNIPRCLQNTSVVLTHWQQPRHKYCSRPIRNVGAKRIIPGDRTLLPFFRIGKSASSLLTAPNQPGDFTIALGMWRILVNSPHHSIGQTHHLDEHSAKKIIVANRSRNLTTLTLLGLSRPMVFPIHYTYHKQPAFVSGQSGRAGPWAIAQPSGPIWPGLVGPQISASFRVIMCDYDWKATASTLALMHRMPFLSIRTWSR